jgi:hypothetical protein
MAAEMTSEQQTTAMEAVKGRLIGMLEENKIDDAAVRRFCVARDYDVDATTKMLSDYIVCSLCLSIALPISVSGEKEKKKN